MTDYTGKQIGNYRVLRFLGSGGFADVYLGEHVYLHTQAAIKMLTTRLAEDGLTSFQQEAQTIASLDHPHIVRVLDFGIQDQTPFLVMAYASGGTLRQHHPAGTRLTLLPIVDYVTQIADALQYAHDRKIIHRDIKPENVLIGANGAMLLSDFGMAVLSQSSRYQGKQDVGGTVAYMAPEQLQGQASTASDQYALGIVVYEWLAGQRPFTGSFVEVCSQHLLTPPPSLRKLVPNLSPAVEEVVFTALRKEPHKRFQTVKAFANALANALDDTHTSIKTKRTTNEIPLDQNIVSTFVKTPPPASPATPPLPANPAWAPLPDQNIVSTFATPPLPTSPAWTPPPGWPGAPTVGTYPPPKPPVSRPKSTTGFVMTSIALLILLVVASIAGVTSLLAHNSGNPGSTANTGSSTTQATLTSTSGFTGQTTPTASPTDTKAPFHLAGAETLHPNLTLQCGACDDPVVFTIETMVVSPTNHDMLFTLSMKNNTQNYLNCALSTFTLQSAQDPTPLSASGGPVVPYPILAKCGSSNSVGQPSLLGPGENSSSSTTFTFVPDAGISYTLTAVYREGASTTISFAPATLTF
jgi:serine/threonine protein kinase